MRMNLRAFRLRQARPGNFHTLRFVSARYRHDGVNFRPYPDGTPNGSGVRRIPLAPPAGATSPFGSRRELAAVGEDPAVR
jgi:hypothetical protein